MERIKQANKWASKGQEALEGYWNLKPRRKRFEWFADFLKKIEFSSIYEVGIFSGIGPRIIKNSLPNVVIGGLDVNPNAIEYCKIKIPEAQELQCASVYDMITTTKWDIVYTSGMLLHVPPDGIDAALTKCVEKANKYVMHMEPQGNDKVINGPKEYNPSGKVIDKFRWEPDLITRYQQMGYSPQSVILPEGIKERDVSHLIIVDVTK